MLYEVITGTLRKAMGNIYHWSKSLARQRLGGLRGGLTEAELAQTAGVIPYGVAIRNNFV